MAGQNRSSAVMQQRQVAPDSLDYFPTPPWATRALCEFLAGEVGYLGALSCWEPACGELHMARPLGEYFGQLRASDVHRYADDHDVLDFALTGRTEPAVDWVITNPPFKLALDFIETASIVARQGFAMLVRSAFLEGADRWRQLWSKNPPSYVLQFVERVVMLEGRLVQAGAVDPFTDDERKASTATSYVWLVWIDGEPETKLRWIAPCRQHLERPGDYPAYAAEVLPPPADGLFGAAA